MRARCEVQIQRVGERWAGDAICVVVRFCGGGGREEGGGKENALYCLWKDLFFVDVIPVRCSDAEFLTVEGYSAISIEIVLLALVLTFFFLKTGKVPFVSVVSFSCASDPFRSCDHIMCTKIRLSNMRSRTAREETHV